MVLLWKGYAWFIHTTTAVVLIIAQVFELVPAFQQRITFHFRALKIECAESVGTRHVHVIASTRGTHWWSLFWRSSCSLRYIIIVGNTWEGVFAQGFELSTVKSVPGVRIISVYRRFSIFSFTLHPVFHMLPSPTRQTPHCSHILLLFPYFFQKRNT